MMRGNGAGWKIASQHPLCEVRRGLSRISSLEPVRRFEQIHHQIQVNLQGGTHHGHQTGLQGSSLEDFGTSQTIPEFPQQQLHRSRIGFPLLPSRLERLPQVNELVCVSRFGDNLSQSAPREVLAGNHRMQKLTDVGQDSNCAGLAVLIISGISGFQGGEGRLLTVPDFPRGKQCQVMQERVESPHSPHVPAH